MLQDFTKTTTKLCLTSTTSFGAWTSSLSLISTRRASTEFVKPALRPSGSHPKEMHGLVSDHIHAYPICVVHSGKLTISGAWTWVSSGNAASLGQLKDPQNKLIFQMHQYLDSDGSGTSATCVSSTIFQERLVAATNWLKQNNKLGLIGEFAGGNNQQCIDALIGGLKYLKANRDVW